MVRSHTEDQLPRLSRAEKRAWRLAERRARIDHDTEQLAELLGMAAAGGGVTGVMTPADPVAADLVAGGRGVELATSAEMIIDGRRLRAGRVHRRTLSKLRESLTSIATVPLTAVSRYGPYWVLTFRTATEQLVLLVDHLTLLPEWGGPGGRDLIPAGAAPFAGAGV
jgi:hypothetical protein